MQTSVVTGATSYLGLSLTNRLISEGIEVHAVVRPTSNIARLSNILGEEHWHIYDGTQKSLINMFSKIQPDTVFHLAGKYIREEKPEDAETLIASNIIFGSQLLAAIPDSSVKYFINTGSYFQFSGNDDAPVNFYGATKNSFISILDYYSRLKHFKSTSLIIYDSYGPDDWRTKLFPNILNAVKNNVTLMTPKNKTYLYPVYYSDIIDCYLVAADQLIRDPLKVANQKFAVRSNQPYSIEEIIATFESILNKKISVEPGQWPKSELNIIDIWRGSTTPNWTPKYSLEEGIKSILQD